MRRTDIHVEGALQLKELEKRLNEDDEFRAKFLADPVATLEQAGVELPESAKAALPKLTESLRTKTPAVPGSTLAPRGADVEISINISKDF